MIEIFNHRYPVRALIADLFLIQAWIPAQQTLINAPAWFMSALISCTAIYCCMMKFGMYLTSPKRFLYKCIVFWAFSQLSLWSIINTGTEPSYYFLTYFPISHLSSFLLGVALGNLIKEKSMEMRLGVWITGFILSFVICVICLKLVTVAPSEIVRMAGIGLFAPLFGVLIFFIMKVPQRIKTHIDTEAFRFLGALAFPIYLFQVPVFKVFEHFLKKIAPGTDENFFFMMFIGILCLTSAIWLLFEKRISYYFGIRSAGNGRKT